MFITRLAFQPGSMKYEWIYLEIFQKNFNRHNAVSMPTLYTMLKTVQNNGLYAQFRIEKGFRK